MGMLFLGSCDTFLEEDLRDQITPDAFFTNDTEAALATNGVYRLYHDTNLYNTRGLDNYYTSGADIQAASRDVNSEIHNYLIAEGTADGNGTWVQLYRVVNNTTTFIEGIEGSDAISQEAKDLAYRGATFFKGLGLLSFDEPVGRRTLLYGTTNGKRTSSLDQNPKRRN